MRFGAEILRGVRLAAIVFAVGLVAILAYRMVAVDDEPRQVSAHPAKVLDHTAHLVKEQTKGSAVVPLPPPVGGRVAPAAVKAQAPEAKETTIVTLPDTSQTFGAASRTVDDPHTLPSLTADDARPVALAQADPGPVEQPKPESRATRALKSVRRFLRLGK